MCSTDITGGMVIWRNEELEHRLAEHEEDLLELARYRRDCSREASLEQRDAAHRWRQEKIQKEAEKAARSERLKREKEDAELKMLAAQKRTSHNWGVLRNTILSDD